MRYLIADIVRRHPLVCSLGAVAIVVAVILGIVVALANGDAREYIDASSLTLGLMAAFLGPVFLSVDLTQGAWDVLRTMPCRRRRLATLAWLSAATGPVLITFLTLLPGLLFNVLARPDAGPLLLRILVERLMLCLGVASFYCLLLSAMPLVKRLPEPIRSVCSIFIGACWGFGFMGAAWGMGYLYTPEGAELRLAALELSLVCATLAWPGLYLLLQSGSGRTLWQQRQGLGRALSAGSVRFPPRAAGLGAPWTIRIGIVLLMVIAAVGLAAYNQSHPEAKLIAQALNILSFGIIMFAFSGVNIVMSVKMWRALPLRPGRLAAILLSLPVLMLATAAVAGLGAVRVIGISDLPSNLFLLSCAVLCATTLCEPLMLKFGAKALVAVGMPFGLLMVIGANVVASGISPVLAGIGVVVLVGLSHLWLFQLLTRDSYIYRKVLEFNSRWNTGR